MFDKYHDVIGDLLLQISFKPRFKHVILRLFWEIETNLIVVKFYEQQTCHV